MKIFITGDTHGDLFDLKNRIESQKIPDGSTILVTGDFGFLWKSSDTVDLIVLNKLPFLFLFIDGNHENFDMLNSFETEVWKGGKIHRISPNIIHLMRGQVYNIDGKKFFSFGGAYSVDRHYRTENVTWWKQEIPSFEEYEGANQNLLNCNYNVDYVITHTLPQSAIHKIGKVPASQDSELTGYFEWLYKEKLTFQHWFAGHFHINKCIEDNLTVLYDDVIELNLSR